MSLFFPHSHHQFQCYSTIYQTGYKRWRAQPGLVLLSYFSFVGSLHPNRLLPLNWFITLGRALLLFFFSFPSSLQSLDTGKHIFLNRFLSGPPNSRQIVRGKICSWWLESLFSPSSQSTRIAWALECDTWYIILTCPKLRVSHESLSSFCVPFFPRPPPGAPTSRATTSSPRCPTSTQLHTPLVFTSVILSARSGA